MKDRSMHQHVRLNARLVREKDRARARDLRRLLLYGAALAVPLLLYVWQRVEFLGRSYELEALKKQKQELVEMNKQLTVERSFLVSPARVEKIARQKLGLREPSPQDVRRVLLIDGRVDEIGGAVAANPGGPPPPANRFLAAAALLVHPRVPGDRP